MNNKGQQTIFMSVVIGLFVLLVGMLAVNFIRMLVDGTPDSESNMISKLNCDSPGISDGNMVVCLVAEAINPVVILSILALAGGIIIARFLL
ncbi:hypothetical protein M0R04_14575 [Candidatus Dojkabacteria bacterium]|jgi:hypothetical protein|nr:hypothetical protein [Candidatus Dojkabacteria bacterium]